MHRWSDRFTWTITSSRVHGQHEVKAVQQAAAIPQRLPHLKLAQHSPPALQTTHVGYQVTSHAGPMSATGCGLAQPGLDWVAGKNASIYLLFCAPVEPLLQQVILMHQRLQALSKAALVQAGPDPCTQLVSLRWQRWHVLYGLRAQASGLGSSISSLHVHNCLLNRIEPRANPLAIH